MSDNQIFDVAAIRSDSAAQAEVRNWIEVLRSGEYEQGGSVLRTDQDQYCCLGVYLDLIEPDGWHEEAAFAAGAGCLSFGHQNGADDYAEGATNNEPFFYLNDATRERLHLTVDGQRKLGVLNDDGDNGEGYTFAQIADYIEAQLAFALRPAGVPA